MAALKYPSIQFIIQIKLLHNCSGEVPKFNLNWNEFDNLHLRFPNGRISTKVPNWEVSKREKPDITGSFEYSLTLEPISKHRFPTTTARLPSKFYGCFCQACQIAPSLSPTWNSHQ